MYVLKQPCFRQTTNASFVRRNTYMRTLIRVGDLKIRSMPSNPIFIATSVASKNVQQASSVVQCLSAIVSLHYTDHIRGPFSFVLQTSHPVHRVQSKCGLDHGVDELLLYQLKGRKGSLKLVPLKGVGSRGFDAVL